MTNDEKAIDKARMSIGDMAQAEIRKLDVIDVQVTLRNENGPKPLTFYTIRFYRDNDRSRDIWNHPEILETS